MPDKYLWNPLNVEIPEFVEAEEQPNFWQLLMRIRTTQPNMPGVATSAISFNRDIPRVESTVGKDLAYSGALLASPAIFSPAGLEFSKNMFIGLPAFEVADRLPTLIGQDRATAQAGNLLENGFRWAVPNGSFENAVAPYINQAGQVLGGLPVGGGAEMLTRSAASGIVGAIAKRAAKRAANRMGYLVPLSESMAETPVQMSNLERSNPNGYSDIRTLLATGEMNPAELEVRPSDYTRGTAASNIVRGEDNSVLRTADGYVIRRGRDITNGIENAQEFYYDNLGRRFSTVADAERAGRDPLINSRPGADNRTVSFERDSHIEDAVSSGLQPSSADAMAFAIDPYSGEVVPEAELRRPIRAAQAENPHSAGLDSDIDAIQTTQRDQTDFDWGEWERITGDAITPRTVEVEPDGLVGNELLEHNAGERSATGVRTPSAGPARPLIGEHDNMDSILASIQHENPDAILPVDLMERSPYQLQRLARDNGFPVKIEWLPGGRYSVSLQDLPEYLTRVRKDQTGDISLDLSKMFNSLYGDTYRAQIPNLRSEDLVKLWAGSFGRTQGHSGGSGAFRRAFVPRENGYFKQVAKELSNRYGLNFSSPYHYDEVAEFLRFNPESPYAGYNYALPGDVGHLSWFTNTEPTSAGTAQVMEDIASLVKGVPRGSAITELNTSPDSYLLELSKGLKEYGIEPGQVEVKFLKDSRDGYQMGRRNTHQKPELTKEQLIDSYKKNHTEQEAVEFEKYIKNVVEKRVFSGDSPDLQEVPEYEEHIKQEIQKAADAGLKRINKWLEKAREITRQSDIPDAAIRDNPLGDNLIEAAYKELFLTNSLRVPYKSPDFYLIKHKYGGLLNRLKSHYGDISKAKEAVHKFGAGGDARKARGYNAFLAAQGEEDSPLMAKMYNDAYGQVDKAREFVQNYYNSEGYKKRAFASGLSEESPVGNLDVSVNPTMKLRESMNSGTTAKIGLLGDQGIPGSMYPLPGTGIINTVGDVTAHELGHQNRNYWRLKDNPNGLAAPKQSIDILNSFKKAPANEHDAQTNESYSDLLQLRYQLQDLGIFDSTDPNAVFEKGMLKQYRNATGGGNSRYLYLHGDDNTVKAINEVAQNSTASLANLAASGGGIHIKPSHRGRLTELKKRTGKSEAELYNDGNPAHKKMVVFARNARKWKHGDGGLLDRMYNASGGDREKIMQMIQKAKMGVD